MAYTYHQNDNGTGEEIQYRCEQCNAEMGGLEYLALGPICGKCVRKNHRRVVKGR